LAGTTIAEALGPAVTAPTTATFSPPAAANTGGASPTLPMSIAPDPMACRIGGPEVKSDHSTLNGSLWIRPAALSSAWDPDPAWSPTCRTTLDTLTVPALAVDDGPELLALDEEQPAAMSARSATATAAVTRDGCAWCRGIY
jgi:hypothetical protein